MQREAGGCRTESVGTRISVLLPVYNAGAHLDLCLESICSSRYPKLEICVLDDGSTDGSRARLERWRERDDRIRLRSLDTNSGYTAARNALITMASGEILAIHDQDDLSHRDRFAIVAETWDAEGWDLFFSRSLMIDAANRVRMASTQLRPASYFLRSNNNFIAHGSVAITSAAMKRVGGYREVVAEDLDLMLRALRAGLRFRSFPRPLYARRIHVASESSGKAQQFLTSGRRMASLPSVVPKPHDIDGYYALKLDVTYGSGSLRAILPSHPLWAVRIALTRAIGRHLARRHRHSVDGFPNLGWAA